MTPRNRSEKRMIVFSMRSYRARGWIPWSAIAFRRVFALGCNVLRAQLFRQQQLGATDDDFFARTKPARHDESAIHSRRRWPIAEGKLHGIRLPMSPFPAAFPKQQPFW